VTGEQNKRMTLGRRKLQSKKKCGAWSSLRRQKGVLDEEGEGLDAGRARGTIEIFGTGHGRKIRPLMDSGKWLRSPNK